MSLLLHRGGLGYLDNSYTDCIGQLKRPSWTEFDLVHHRQRDRTWPIILPILIQTILYQSRKSTVLLIVMLQPS
jgi:hypothetical protein